MNLTTNYLGLTLDNPLMPGASPLADDLDMVRRLEDAGAAAIVMRSLFQEQIEGDYQESSDQLQMYADCFAESADFFPGAREFSLNRDTYLEQLRRVKAAVRVPVIASINGISPTGWLLYARLMEQAGADALELNVYHIATNVRETANDIERRILDTVRQVRQEVKMPLAIKLSPYFTALPHLAMELRVAGVDGLILFNRFYQPDIDLEALDVMPHLQLSDSSELLPRLRWLAILSGRTTASLACSGGVHTYTDVVKAIMAGADVVQVVSALLKRGPEYLKTLLHDLRQWMHDNEYASIGRLRGIMSLDQCPDPAAFERGNYMRVLASWRRPENYPARFY
jgi:dihydroorotate dehydrogenase (fumarate)